MSVEEESSESLIERVPRDAEAVECLFERHGRSVHAFVSQFFGEGHPVVADVVHDIWLKVLKNAETFRGETSFDAWLQTIARNACRDVIRKKKKRAKKSKESAPSEVPDPDHQDPYTDAGTLHFSEAVSREPDPGEEAMTNMILADALKALPPAQKEVVLLYRAGLTLTEIAERTGVSESTAKSRWRYAMDKLKDIFGVQSEEG